MTKKKEKGFTLIELIGVLVIMAILALIVTPLVMNIIRKARVAADKRSVDAYGRSIELAIASYLLDNGKFPTEISQLTIEYSGNEVVCSTTQLNTDSSVYLTGCTVGGRTVDYAYGSDKSPSYTAYTVGNLVTYNGVDYYVIKESGVKESTVTLLKAEPLTDDEIISYAEESGAQYIIDDYYRQIYIAYYESETCGEYDYEANNGSFVETGCTNDYTQSNVKKVVDVWAKDKVPSGLQEARLITFNEYAALSNTEEYITPTESSTIYNPQYDWMYNSNYSYYTMTPYEDSNSQIWYVNTDGNLSHYKVFDRDSVRPVIVLDKSVLITEQE